MSAQTSDKESLPIDEPRSRQRPISLFKLYILTDVNVASSALQLAMLCLCNGFVDGVAFTACYVWPGFQTGNTVQLALALARLFSPGDIPDDEKHGFLTPDALALCSLLSFIAGTFTVRFKPSSLGFKTRGWLVSSLVLQALLTMAAALTSHYSKTSSFASSRATPSWNDALGFAALGFLSASMGVQGVMGTKLASPMATTVVLTSVYCNIALDPTLTTFSFVSAREQKFLAVAAAFIGGLFGRALVGQIGAANTLWVGTGLRFVTALLWLVAKGVPPKEKKAQK